MMHYPFAFPQIHSSSTYITTNRPKKNITGGQGVSQDLERGCPNLLEISKQGVQIAHLQYFFM